MKLTESSSVVSSIYRSGRIYDLLYPGTAAERILWSELAKAFGDPILELMSGTGFIAIPLAQQGHDVTGVEIAEPMLVRQVGERPIEPDGELTMRIYFPQELDALLWYNGFAIEHKYGEDARPFDAESGMQYYVLKLRD